MVLGILKDRKSGVHRVILTPSAVKEIVGNGHEVLLERGAGVGAGFSDEKYEQAGAKTVNTREEIFGQCDLVTKVKEILPEEFRLLRPGQIIFSCIHPAANFEEVEALLRSRCIAFTLEDTHRYGSVNSEAAGKVGAILGIESLFSTQGGKGKYVGGLCGSPGINALILGGGVAGEGALSVLYSLGASVTVMDVNLGRLYDLLTKYNSRIGTLPSEKERIRELLPKTDLVINSVKWQKEKKDFLIDRQMLSLMEEGSVIVDISGDDPGAIETSRCTTYLEPRYKVNGVVHLAVSNLPSAVSSSVSSALSSEVLPLILSLMNKGVREACIRDGYLRRALTVYEGYLTHEETSALQKRPWITPEKILGIEDMPLESAPRATKTRSDYFIKI
jgi:alanine dehydrogenase